MSNKLLFCKRGHDIAIVGRYTNGKCKECFRAWDRAWTKANPEKSRIKSNRWYKANLDKAKIMGRKQGWNKQGILNQLGLPFTLEDYNKLFDEQQGCCFICKRHQDLFNKSLHVDHNHKTGKVRGLLCSNCNLKLVSTIEQHYNLIGRIVSYLDLHEFGPTEVTLKMLELK